MDRKNFTSDHHGKSRMDVGDSVIVLLFLGSLFMRMIAASKLPLNAFESALLMDNSGIAIAWENPISLIESILIKITYLIFGQTQFGARVWPALAGSLLALIPLYLKQILGKKLSRVLALLFVIEPFLLANSLQIGSNIFTILGLSLTFAALVKNDRLLTFIGGWILLLSGRGLLPALVLIAVLYLYDRNSDTFSIYKTENADFKIYGFKLRFQHWVAIVLAVLIFSFLKIDFSSILSSLSAFFPQTPILYFQRANLLGLPVVLISYAPLYFSLFLIFCFRFYEKTKGLVLVLLISVITLSFWIVLMPGKNYLDLVWLTLPMLIGSAYYLSELSVKELNPNAIVKLLISSILIISFMVSFSQFIYQGRYRLSQVNSLINVITILFLFIIIYFAFLAFGSGREYVQAFGIALLFVGFVLQAVFAFRAGGFPPNVSQELLWSGAIADDDIVKRTLDMRSDTSGFVDNDMLIGVEYGLSPQLAWFLKDEKVSAFPAGTAGPIPLDIVFTQENTIQLNGKYVGQTLNADVFPKWIETPVRSLFDYDYWSWLIFRNANMEKVIHHIWYAME